MQQVLGCCTATHPKVIGSGHSHDPHLAASVPPLLLAVLAPPAKRTFGAYIFSWALTVLVNVEALSF